MGLGKVKVPLSVDFRGYRRQSIPYGKAKKSTRDHWHCSHWYDLRTHHNHDSRVALREAIAALKGEEEEEQDEEEQEEEWMEEEYDPLEEHLKEIMEGE